MQRRHLRLLLPFLAAALVGVASPAAQAATLVVDDSDQTPDTEPCGSEANPCDTIEAALLIAQDGDTLDVRTGVYQGPVAVAKDVTLLGAQSDADARTRSGVPESVVNAGFEVSASGVTIDGFVVEDAASDAGIELSGGGTGRIIEDNVIRDNVFGLYLNGSQTEVRRNRFEANNLAGPVAGSGIYSDQGASNVLIEDNAFSGHENVSVNFSGTQSDIEISGNQLVGDSTMFLSNSTGVTIADNVSSSPHFHAVQLAGGNVDVNIVRNEFTDAEWSAVRVSGDGNRDVVIRSNTLTGQGDHALKVSDGAHTGAVELEWNRIGGSGINGVQNHDSDSVVAAHNWWGCNAGPGVEAFDEPGSSASGCDDVAGAVDFEAWLLLGLGASPAAIQTGGETATLAVDLTRTSSGDDFAAVPVPPSPIDFTTSLGGLAAARVPLAGGLASNTLTSGSEPGTANVTAELDSQVLAASVRFDLPPEPPPSGGGSQQQDSAPQAPAGNEPPTDVTGPAVGLVRRTLRVSRRGEVSLSLFCPQEETAGCAASTLLETAGAVRVKPRRPPRRVPLGRKTSQLPPGQISVVRVKLARKNRALLRRLRRVRVNVIVVATDAAGNATRVSLPMTLIGERRRRSPTGTA